MVAPGRISAMAPEAVLAGEVVAVGGEGILRRSRGGADRRRGEKARDGEEGESQDCTHSESATAPRPSRRITVRKRTFATIAAVAKKWSRV